MAGGTRLGFAAARLDVGGGKRRRDGQGQDGGGDRGAEDAGEGRQREYVTR
jgi:hypothetical protein